LRGARASAAGSTADDVAFLLALLDRALANPGFDPDPSRVYLAAASNGGTVESSATTRASSRTCRTGIDSRPAIERFFRT
jgi:poly(3-hydroxybutyrate) depolymerase